MIASTLAIFTANIALAEVLPVKPDSTSVCIPLEVKHSSTGAGLTGLVYNSASLVCHYWRDSAASATAITLVDGTVGTFTSGAFKEVSSSNMPGLYTLCLPNAALSSGARTVAVECKGATNMKEAEATISLGAIADVVTAVFDESINPSHMTAGTAGYKLNAAASLNLTCGVTN